MKSVVIHAEGSVRVEERPMPTINADDDVLVKVVCSGLCGSDIPRIFAGGAHYYPITLGHEFSGYVERCGSAVSDLSPGDAVGRRWRVSRTCYCRATCFSPGPGV